MMLSGFNRNNIGKNLLFKVVPACLFIFLLSTSLLSFIWKDDLYNLYAYKTRGILNDLVYQYFVWDGRVLSPVFLFRNLMLKYLPSQALVFLAILGIFVISYIIERCNLFLFRINNGRFRLSVVILAGFLLWSGFRAHISKSIYYPTGTFYAFVNVCLILWMYYYVRNQNKVLNLLLVFIVSTSGVNIASAMFAFVVCAHFFNFRKLVLKKDLFWILLFVFGFLITTLAPGNFARSQHNYSGFDLDILNLLPNYLIVLKGYLSMSKWVFIGALFVGVIWAGGEHLQNGKKEVVFFSISLFVAGLFSILPFIILPKSASSQTVIHFQTLTFWGLGLLTAVAIAHYLQFFKLKIAFVFMLLISAYAFYLTGQQFKWGWSVKKQINQRFTIMEKKRGTADTVRLPLVTMHPGLFMNRFWDIKDTLSDDNKSLQTYFGTGPVFPIKSN